MWEGSAGGTRRNPEWSPSTTIIAPTFSVEKTAEEQLFSGLLSIWIVLTRHKSERGFLLRYHGISENSALSWNLSVCQENDQCRDNSDWTESPDCIDISETECDLTNHLIPLDRMYSADIKTEPPSTVDIDPDELPHTYSPLFNPYRESNISALKFTVESVRDGRVTVNITDPVTSIHKHGKQLSIRDILKNDLKYKISYYKSGSTGKRDIIFASSMANISGLDAGHSYCFMVAAFIPSRPKPSQHGVWSTQVCTSSNETVLKDLSFEAWIGVAFILLAALIIIITVSVLCCRQRNKMLRTSQTSAPI
ncbi:tissue factor-like isoform X1 [Parambassis ranga]|uniref:Tissue factor n=1 Tax=Parambassis ranga TaxID=210632 RepID=A0A6P7K4J9_9TELE|nr:tissue factor-like isoform X1 [Parambassis ranga]